MKKHVRYYLVVDGDNITYRKIESDQPFSESEGRREIKSKLPKAKVTHIAKTKAETLLALNKTQ